MAATFLEPKSVRRLLVKEIILFPGKRKISV